MASGGTGHDNLNAQALALLRAELAKPDPVPVTYRVAWPSMGGGYRWVMSDVPLLVKEGFINEALYREQL